MKYNIGDHTFIYRLGKFYDNADAFFRLPIAHQDGDEYPEPFGVYLFKIQELPVTFQEVVLAGMNDPILPQVTKFVRVGWPYKAKLSKDVLSYWNC